MECNHGRNGSRRHFNYHTYLACKGGAGLRRGALISMLGRMSWYREVLLHPHSTYPVFQRQQNFQLIYQKLRMKLALLFLLAFHLLS